MGNTPKIGKYWEIFYKQDLLYIFVFSFFLKKNISNFYRFYHVSVPFKICYKMNCIGTLYKMKMKAASL